MNFWDLKAQFYQWARKPWLLSWVLERETDAILALLKAAPATGGPVLDVGCGPGLSTRLLSGSVSVFALDSSREMIRRNIAAGNRRCVADALHLPVKANSFKLVLCIGLSEYVSDIGLFAAGLAKTLKFEGVLLLTSSPPNLFGVTRNIGGSRLFLRDAQQVCAVFQEKGFTLLNRAHLFSMDVLLFSKTGSQNK